MLSNQLQPRNYEIRTSWLPGLCKTLGRNNFLLHRLCSLVNRWWLG